jgi:hypothetical protein
MKIDLADLTVIVDTLGGSLSLAEGGTLFKYTTEARKHTLEKLLQQMHRVSLTLETSEEKK